MSDSVSPIVNSPEYDEFSKRCWKLVGTQGEEIFEGGPIMVDTDMLTIELSYNSSGREFLDVTLNDDFGKRGGRRIYREVDNERSSNMGLAMLREILDGLRKHMVLDDLADV